jgi:hypothetical protein
MRYSDPKKPDGGHLPWDLSALLAPMLLGILVAVVLPYFSLAERRGDRTLLAVALILGGIGVVLLFFARLPLYRQRRFFVFGASELSGFHKRLYYAAYVFIVPCILILLAMTVF